MNGFIAQAQKGLAKTLLGALFSSLVALNATAGETDAAALLKARKPAEAQAGFFAPTKLLSMAFSDGELSSLAAASGATDCFTNDIRALERDAAGRSVARACIEGRERTYFRRADVLARTQGATVLGLPTYKTNSLTVSEIQRAAMNRLSARLASRSVNNNVVLKSVVEGKVDVDFSLQNLVSGLESAPVSARPTYALAVNYRENGDRNVRVASLAADSFALMGGRSRGTASLVADRQIVEVWPSVAAAPAAETAAPKAATLRVTQLVQRQLGLGAEPFSNVHFRMERSGAFGLQGLRLRLEEASGVAVVDLSGLVQGNSQGVAWTLRVPYYAHAAVFSADNLSQKAKIGYEFRASSSVATSVTYDRNVADGAVPSSTSGRYSLAFGYRF